MDGWADGWVGKASKQIKSNESTTATTEVTSKRESTASGWLLDGIGLTERSRWPCNFQLSSRWWHTIMCPNYVNQVIRINALIINPLERSVRVISSAYDTQTLRI